ncbi:MAG: hypothetical protein ACWGMZ_02295 [Thermoguttaceae bacterium]
MANQPWLDDVKKRLAEQRLPPAYIWRFMEELSDHLQDFKEQNMSTEADVYSRLGQPEQVAQAAVASYRRHNFFNRHPLAAFLFFGLSPVVPQVALGYITVFFLCLLSEILGINTVSTNAIEPFASAACQFLYSLIIFICTSLACLLYFELAAWSCISKKWACISCFFPAGMAVLWQYSLLDEAGFQSVTLPIQFLAPLTFCWWFMRRKNEGSYPVATFWLFAISPVAAMVVLCGVSYFLLFLVSLLFPFPMFNNEHFTRMALLTLANVFNLLMVIIPSVMVSILYCKLAMKYGIGGKWILVSCAMLAVLAGSYCFSVTSTDATGHYYLHDGIGFWSPLQLFQFLIPLAIGLWFMRRKSDQSQLQLAA